MFVKPRVVQFLTSVSVAALITLAPVTGKFDAAGRLTLSSAAANAQPSSFTSLACDSDCAPETGPGGPITDLIDPPTDLVVPPTDPVVPPTDPVELPDSGCEKDSKCVEAKGNASSSNDDDDVPPIVVVDTESVKEEGLAFVKSLRCQTACTASVANDGDVTVTLTSTTQGGDSIETKITQDGPDVATTIVVAEKIVIKAQESFESEDKARDVVADRTRDVPEVVVLKVNLSLEFAFPEDEEPSQAFVADFANALSAELGISAGRIKIFSVNEG